MQPSFNAIGLTTWGFDRKMMLRHTADGGLVGGRPMENPLKISQNERSSYELERIHLQLDMHNIFRQLLLPAAAAVKQLRKNHLPGGKHHASEGRASSKTTPKKCLTSLLKSWKNNIFRQLLLPAAAAVKQLRKNHLPGGKHRASEGRASSKTTPKNCLTSLLKSYRKTTFFDCFCCLRMLQ